jgi:hypothetical protein
MRAATIFYNFNDILTGSLHPPADEIKNEEGLFIFAFISLANSWEVINSFALAHTGRGDFVENRVAMAVLHINGANPSGALTA